jgi:hypothetical protein
MENTNVSMLRRTLPRELMSVGISLDSLGFEDFAWLPQDALEIIRKLTEARIPILGGDVFFLQNNKPTHTIDSWYIKRKEEYASPKAFLEESEQKAVNYIKAYTKRNGSAYCFSFVLYKFPIGN